MVAGFTIALTYLYTCLPKVKQYMPVENGWGRGVTKNDSSYASFDVGHLNQRREEKQQFGRFRVMTLAVYFSYFKNLVGCRNVLRSRLGVLYIMA